MRMNEGKTKWMDNQTKVSNVCVQEMKKERKNGNDDDDDDEHI